MEEGDSGKSLNKWLRYGKPYPEFLERAKKTTQIIITDSNLELSIIFVRCFMYYLDVVLDLSVAVKYIGEGQYEWAAVTLCMFAACVLAELLRSYQLAVKHELPLIRTSVFMLPWNAVFAKEPPEDVAAMISIQLDSIGNEGLFEAPSQLSFQCFVVMHMWGLHGQPSTIQLASVLISIGSLGMANVEAFDLPYLFLGKKKHHYDRTMTKMKAAYIGARGLQLVYRVISLSILLLTFGIWYGGLFLLPMVCIRGYLLKGSYSDTSQHAWLPPLSVLIGSLFSDAFLGDAHFLEHLPNNKSLGGSTAGSGGTSTTTRAKVSPLQQHQQKEGDSSDSASSIASTTNFVSHQPVLKESLRRVEPTAVAAGGGGEQAKKPTGHALTQKEKKGKKDRLVRRAQESLMLSEIEVCSEVTMVAWGVLLVAVECWLCFAMALVKLDQFEVDPFVIGWMALFAGSCMLLRTGLYWGIFCTPMRDVPRRAVPVVRGVLVANMLLAVSILGVAVETGIVPDDCFGIECGPASQCIPLTGTYQCDCTEGRSEKLPGAAGSKDMCIDINECTVGTHTCVEDHLWCVNTPGSYECGSCGVGSYASDDGQCTVKICFSSGKLLPGQHKISSTLGEFEGLLDDGDLFGSSVAVLGDLDKDGVFDLAVGAYGDNDGADNSGAVYVMFMTTDGGVKAHQKISATQGGLVGPLGGGDEFGIAVAGLGDLDKDGIEDMIVGAHHDRDGAAQAGAVYVVFLHENGRVKAEQKISATQGGFTGAWLRARFSFGRAVAAVGDVNGDGVMDIVVREGVDPDPYLDIKVEGLGATTKDRYLTGGGVWVVMLEPNGMVKEYQGNWFVNTCTC